MNRRHGILAASLVYLALSIGLVGCSGDDEPTHYSPDSSNAGLRMVGQVADGAVVSWEIAVFIGLESDVFEEGPDFTGCFSSNGSSKFDDYDYDVLRHADVAVNDVALDYQPEPSIYEPNDFRKSTAVFSNGTSSGLNPQPGDSVIWRADVENLEDVWDEDNRRLRLPDIFPVELPENGLVVSPWDTIAIEEIAPDSVRVYCLLYADRERTHRYSQIKLAEGSWHHLRIPSEVESDTLWLVSQQVALYPGNYTYEQGETGVYYEQVRYLLVNHE